MQRGPAQRGPFSSLRAAQPAMGAAPLACARARTSPRRPSRRPSPVRRHPPSRAAPASPLPQALRLPRRRPRRACRPPWRPRRLRSPASPPLRGLHPRRRPLRQAWPLRWRRSSPARRHRPPWLPPQAPRLPRRRPRRACRPPWHRRPLRLPASPQLRALRFRRRPLRQVRPLRWRRSSPAHRHRPPRFPAWHPPQARRLPRRRPRQACPPPWRRLRPGRFGLIRPGLRRRLRCLGRLGRFGGRFLGGRCGLVRLLLHPVLGLLPRLGLLGVAARLGREHARGLEEARDPIGRLRPQIQPVLDAVEVHLDAVLAALGKQRVVGSQLLDEAPVAGHARVSRDDAIERTLLAAPSGKADFHGHVGFSL